MAAICLGLNVLIQGALMKHAPLFEAGQRWLVMVCFLFGNLNILYVIDYLWRQTGLKINKNTNIIFHENKI